VGEVTPGGDPRDPGRIDLSHSTPSGPGWIEIALLVLVISIAVALPAVIFAQPERHLACPSGYALAGGGFAGALHCVPGVEPTWVPGR
jgi:hypothetical protein